MLAAGLFLIGYKPFMILVDYYSGIAIPSSLTSEQRGDLFALLLGAPTLFSFGYLAAIKLKFPALTRWKFANAEIKISAWYPVLIFSVAASVGIYDLARTGCFSKLRAWVDYGQWVQARWGVFSSLGHFNFVNLYLIVPITASWVLLCDYQKKLRTQIFRWVPTIIALSLTFFLFQKKAMVTALIIIFSGLFLLRTLHGEGKRKLKTLLIASIGFIAVVYFFLLVLPIYLKTSRTADAVLTPPTQQKMEENNRRRAAIISVLGPKRSLHVFFYALLAPVTRTAAPAMYYPIVFPEHHEYYGLDFGQDILGWGSMPDDNRVVWKFMYPDIPGGSVMVPFQFTLYSQVGTGWTLLLSAVVGLLLGFIWMVIVESKGDLVWRSLMGALSLLFSIYIAIDSVRGSLLTSYGVIWGWVFVIIFFYIGRTLMIRLNSGKT